MSIGIIFAIGAAVVFGLWTVFHNQAATQISPILGAILVSLTAVIIGVPFFIREWLSGSVHVGLQGFIFVVLAGISAFALDYLVLRTYATDIPISVGGPIIIGGSILIAVVIGLFLGEHITPLKSLGILLVVMGASILATFA